MTRLIAQVAMIIAIATWLLDIFGPGEGVDWLSLGVLVAAPIVANLILGALSRQREYQADLEAVELTGDPAGLARAIELIEMAQKRITSSVFPRAVRIRCHTCCRRTQILRTGSGGFANRRPKRGRRVRTSASPYRTISRTSGSGGCRRPTGWVDRRDGPVERA